MSGREDRSTVSTIGAFADVKVPEVKARLFAVFPRAVADAAAAAAGGSRRGTLIGSAAVVIGREPGSDGIVVDHETVSRRHLVVTWDPRRAVHTAVDLGSRNGSRVDGLPLSDLPQPLGDGSVLRIGDALLVYERGHGIEEPDADLVSREAAPGEARAMYILRSLLARAALDPAPVLIIGETGAGKERIAAEVHRLGRRGGGPLVPVNCAALSPQLVESQLFGHARGSFTGAIEAQAGLFRAATGGTLFLDEVGEMPIEMQPKLLRAIEQREVQPVGTARPVRIDLRIVAATNRDLGEACATGRFRPDLYARLAVWELRMPPLRERRADLMIWIERLHRLWSEERGGAPAPRFTADAAEAMLRFAWPLNLRSVERLIHDIGTSGNAAGEVDLQRLPAWLKPPPPASPAPAGDGDGRRAAAAVDSDAARVPIPSREEFLAAYDRLEGSVRGLARHFGRDRRQIYRWLQTYGLKGEKQT